MTDQVIGFHDFHNLYLIASGFILLIVIQSFSEMIRSNLVIYAANHLTAQFSSQVVQHLLKLPLSFFENRHKGDLFSKFQSIDQIQKKITTDFINMVLDGFMIVLNFLVMLTYSRLLTAIVMSAQSIYLVLRYISFQFLKKQTQSSVVQHAHAASVFLETLGGIMPIKSFLKERVRFNYWRNAYINALNADIQVSRMTLVYSVSSLLFFHVEHIIVVCVGVFLIVNHQFSLGMLLAFLSFRMLLVNKAGTFMQNIFDYRLISIQLNRLVDILFKILSSVK